MNFINFMKSVDKVEKGGYAFMMESAGIQYIVERRCSLGKYKKKIHFQFNFNQIN